MIAKYGHLALWGVTDLILFLELFRLSIIDLILFGFIVGIVSTADMALLE